jgi:hypothetical protein
VRYLALIVWAAAIGACATPREIHIQGRGETHRIVVSESRLDARLLDAAREYGKYAPIPRIALSTVSLPVDRQEYYALSGFAVVVITVLSQEPAELPPSRVFVRVEGKELDLTRLASRQGTDTDSALVARVFGASRFDGLYLYPMLFRALGAQLVLNFAISRSDFVVATFPQVPADAFPIDAPTAEQPDPEALARLIARQVPIFAGTGTPP